MCNVNEVIVQTECVCVNKLKFSNQTKSVSKVSTFVATGLLHGGHLM